MRKQSPQQLVTKCQLSPHPNPLPAEEGDEHKSKTLAPKPLIQSCDRFASLQTNELGKGTK